MSRRVYRKVLPFRKDKKNNSEISDSPEFPKNKKHSNSFLIEIEHNHDIDLKTRIEIEEKFKKSSINANYVFPRSAVNENIVLPKIKLERGNSSYNESAMIIDTNILKTSIEARYDEEASLSKKFKVQSFNKPVGIIEKRNHLQSITPSPYFSDLKIGSNHLADSKRNTPSPGPIKLLSIKHDKRRFL